MSNDSMLVRLSEEYTELMNMSDYCRRCGGRIEVKPENVKNGWPPEEYIVIFRCKGVAGITKENKPVYAELHKVRITLNSGFPGTEPALEWLTPIWHPNILHVPPHNVCTHNLDSWWPGQRLVNLILKLGDLVQYKHYHAVDEFPYPLDKKVAEWVVNYAEPSGILGKGKPVDPRPLLPEGKIFSGGDDDHGHAAGVEPEQNNGSVAPPPTKIVLGNKVVGPNPDSTSASAQAVVPRIRLGPKSSDEQLSAALTKEQDGR